MIIPVFLFTPVAVPRTIPRAITGRMRDEALSHYIQGESTVRRMGGITVRAVVPIM